MSIGQRIIEARKCRNISQAGLAVLIGVSRGACGQWEREITTPSVAHLSNLARFLGVRFEWLATGRGEMGYVADVNERAPAVYGKTGIALTEEQQKWLEVYSRLSKGQRASVLAFLQTIR